jgi:hypothetical protein
MISCILRAYGLKFVTASCAFFNLAAATIFMALVICRVEATDAIRVRISFKFAIYLFFIFDSISCSLCLCADIFQHRDAEVAESSQRITCFLFFMP